MTGFLNKLRVVTLGAAHDLLDAKIDMDSPSVLRQYVRDLEDATGKMNSELAMQNGQLRTLLRESGNIDDAKVAAELEEARAIKDTNPDLARKKAAQVLLDQKHLAQIAAEKQVIDQLRTAVDRLVAKHDEVLARVRELESVDRDTKTKEQGAKAMTAAGNVLGMMGTHSVDDLEDRMRRRNDVANAKFDQAMASMPAHEEANSEEVDALLNSK